MLNFLKGLLISWMLASILVVPHLLIRLGKWKDWYLAPTVIPFTYKRVIHLGIPFSFLFLFAPCLAFIPVDTNTRGIIWLSIGAVGFVSGIILAVWAPRWAKPAWQQRLEGRYSNDEINGIFLPVWRQMDQKEWGRLIETEEGLEELVRLARGSGKHS